MVNYSNSNMDKANTHLLPSLNEQTHTHTHKHT